MGVAIVTVQIMPTSPEVDMNLILPRVLEETKKFTENDSVETKHEILPFAFGLTALRFTFVVNEKFGSPDPLAETIRGFEEVESVEVVDVRRALG